MQASPGASAGENRPHMASEGNGHSAVPGVVPHRAQLFTRAVRLQTGSKRSAASQRVGG